MASREQAAFTIGMEYRYHTPNTRQPHRISPHLFQSSRFASSPEASLNRITFRPLFLSTIYGEVCASAFEFFQLGCFAYGWIFRHTLVEETRLQGRGVCLR